MGKGILESFLSGIAQHYENRNTEPGVINLLIDPENRNPFVEESKKPGTIESIKEKLLKIRNIINNKKRSKAEILLAIELIDKCVLQLSDLN